VVNPVRPDSEEEPVENAAVGFYMLNALPAFQPTTLKH